MARASRVARSRSTSRLHTLGWTGWTNTNEAYGRGNTGRDN
jgi:hypothetical protein